MVARQWAVFILMAWKEVRAGPLDASMRLGCDPAVRWREPASGQLLFQWPRRKVAQAPKIRACPWVETLLFAFEPASGMVARQQAVIYSMA